MAAAILASCASDAATTPGSVMLSAPIGEPQLVHAEGSAEYRRYRIGPCQLDLFLRDAASGAGRIEWLDARPAREVDPALAAACTDLALRLRGGQSRAPLVQALSEPL